jgi:LPXTG-motif cell wall-anchored protein
MDLSAQTVISGWIGLDTTRWESAALLSVIPDFTQMHAISNEMIIRESKIGPDGHFIFDLAGLPDEDRLYRIHFRKKAEPRASLIIGGREENHLFIIANQNSEVEVKVRSSPNLLGRVEVTGYAPNKALQEINQIAGFLDTLDYYGPAVNRDFVRQAVFDRLRSYADTCSHPLISLYAIYKSRFETNFPVNQDFYRKYLWKWKSEDSEYFRAFLAQLPNTGSPGIMVPMLVGLAILLLVATGTIIYFRTRKKRNQNHYQSLTVQERKIFSLLREGKTNKEISDICAISLSTVKSHVNSIYTKLKLGSRTEVMDYRESDNHGL